MLNALLLYPDHPYWLGKLYGSEIDENGRRQRFLIADPIQRRKLAPIDLIVLEYVAR